MALLNGGKKQFTLVDLACDEMAILAFAFLVAKYWPVLASLAWYWYLIIMIVFWIKPVMALVKK
ncbi:MAG: hypothetical protein KJ771_02855 [Nanoarchaeota archaeon]|nr:hypothetical protein [Nanoarchaeota archaeon]